MSCAMISLGFMSQNLKEIESFMAKNNDRETQEQMIRKRKMKVTGLAMASVGLSLMFGGFPLSLFGGAVVVAIGYGVYKLIRTMSEGLDTTTHNRQDKPKEFEELKATTGDTYADEVIAKGKDALVEIRQANDEIKDPDLTRKMYEIEEKCTQIFRTIEEKPDKAFQIRKFMNYYLPTTLKMLRSYRSMQQRGVSERELAQHRFNLNRGLDMVITACQKQLDNLYRDSMLDMSTDVDVLEQMLRRDGFTDSELSEASISQAMEDARTAAAAQLADREIPYLVVPGEPYPEERKAVTQVHRRDEPQ